MTKKKSWIPIEYILSSLITKFQPIIAKVQLNNSDYITRSQQHDRQLEYTRNKSKIS